MWTAIVIYHTVGNFTYFVEFLYQLMLLASLLVVLEKLPNTSFWWLYIHGAGKTHPVENVISAKRLNAPSESTAERQTDTQSDATEASLRRIREW